MARIKFLILGLLLVCNLSFAGYAQLKPPPGWSQGMGAAVPGQAGVFAFGAAANASSFKGSTVLTNAALSVAGQLVTIPVSMRVAANAATVAAQWSFGNPLMFAGVLAATTAYGYYKAKNFEVIDGIWKVKQPGNCVNGVCGMYVANPWSGYYVYAGASMSSAGGAAVSHFSSFNSTRQYIVSRIEGSEGGPVTVFLSMRTIGAKDAYGNPAPYSVDYNNLSFAFVEQPPSPPTYRPATQDEFVTGMGQQPFPDTLPQELPDVKFPTQLPTFNPDPLISPQPAPYPAAVPRPLFIPTGLPVPTPDPAIWNQPGVRVTPTPTTDSPWQVDVQPENLPQNSPTPKTQAELNPTPGTPGSPSTPGVPSENPGLCDMYPGIAACAPADKYAPGDEAAKDPAKTPGTPEFCAANPTALMCLKTDTPESDDLEKKDKTIAITPDSGWGSGGGSCPAPRRFSKGEFSFQTYCDFASGIKPVIISVAWLVAAGILIGFKFGES